jgi:hypothetical protein
MTKMRLNEQYVRIRSHNLKNKKDEEKEEQSSFCSSHVQRPAYLSSAGSFDD